MNGRYLKMTNHYHSKEDTLFYIIACYFFNAKQKKNLSTKNSLLLRASTDKFGKNVVRIVGGVEREKIEL